MFQTVALAIGVILLIVFSVVPWVFFLSFCTYVKQVGVDQLDWMDYLLGGVSGFIVGLELYWLLSWLF